MLAEHLFPTELSGEVESFIKKMLESSYVEEADEEVLSSMPDMLNECPACHYTLENFRTTGLLGCPECYKTFGAELVQIDHEVQPDGEPRRAMEAEYMESPALERGRLELLMHEAVSHENYEEAARLRDRIKQLSDNEKKKQ